MSIAQHSIRDEGSFVSSTQGREAAALYFHQQLDCLVDLAHEVAGDFFARPELYVGLGDSTVDKQLARLRAQYGTNEQVPSAPQREQMYTAVFGPPTAGRAGAGENFERVRKELLDACTAFAERVYDTGLVMLRDRIVLAHRPFKAYLQGLQGASLEWSTREALRGEALQLAYPILRNSGVCAVFGISRPPQAEWPFREDANGDKLVEQITRQLRTAEGRPGGITRERFSSRQRLALRGAEALATILDYNEEEHGDKDQNVLITKCYTWGSSLNALLDPPAARAPFTE
ncbi:hypothetical protein [Streptomyces sp. 2A115]|uniref:hypothetical protein n=1 Tax=Streptomyces sp. 2A115 TaxID=3457439 RepID=UPI003FD13067